MFVLPADDNFLALLTFIAGNAAGGVGWALCPLANKSAIIDKRPRDGKGVYTCFHQLRCKVDHVLVGYSTLNTILAIDFYGNRPITHCTPYRFNNPHTVTGPVFKTTSPVVGSVVPHRAEPAVWAKAVSEMQLNTVESCISAALCRLSPLRYNRADLFFACRRAGLAGSTQLNKRVCCFIG